MSTTTIERLKRFPTGLLILILGVLFVLWNVVSPFGRKATHATTIPADTKLVILALIPPNQPRAVRFRDENVSVADIRTDFQFESCPKAAVAVFRRGWFPLLDLTGFQDENASSSEIWNLWKWYLSIKDLSRPEVWEKMTAGALNYLSQIKLKIAKSCPNTRFFLADTRGPSNICLFNDNVYYAYLARAMISKFYIEDADLNSIVSSNTAYNEFEKSDRLVVGHVDGAGKACSSRIDEKFVDGVLRRLRRRK